MATRGSTVTAPTPERGVAPTRRRGRETATDMIRSMGLVLLIVVPLWFLAQPPKGDAKTIRVVDPTADISSFRAAAPGVPAPSAAPAGWRATSSTLDPSGLRIGYVVPGSAYAEYAASTAPAAQFLPGITGSGTEVGRFTVEGVSWRQLRDADGHDSLVREPADGIAGTVVVGGVRETASLDELRALAVTVR